MLFTKFKMEDALAVRYKEGFVKGEVRGEARGMKKLLSLWEQGLSLKEAKKKLNLA